MAVPKRRTSRSNTRHRRSNWKAEHAQLVPVPGTSYRVPQRLLPAVRRGLVDPATGTVTAR